MSAADAGARLPPPRYGSQAEAVEPGSGGAIATVEQLQSDGLEAKQKLFRLSRTLPDAVPHRRSGSRAFATEPNVSPMDHLAIPVRDQEVSRRFYETYFGFGAKPARRYDDGVLMLYNAAGFTLALGHSDETIERPAWMHFGVGLPDRKAVLELSERLTADGVELVEEWDEPDYVSVKCRDPDGYIVEASWEPQR
jgi:catechol 2,3-dioxygenase-like lactoylglutathione lyase family enzyme